MLYRNWYQGGPEFMSVIYLLALGILALLIYNVITLKAQRKSDGFKRRNEAIIFLGSLTFLIGLLGQSIGIYAALHAIQQAGDISPKLIFGGFRVSMIAPLTGLVVMILSFIIWFVFRIQIKKG